MSLVTDPVQHFDAMSKRIFKALDVPTERWTADNVGEAQVDTGEALVGSASIVEEDAGWLWCNFTMILDNGNPITLKMQCDKLTTGGFTTEFAGVSLKADRFDDFIEAVKESIRQRADRLSSSQADIL